MRTVEALFRFLLLAGLGGTAVALPIPEIQGRGLASVHDGETVTTEGVVTAVDSRGFFLQDPAGDGDPATSDGIFVYTGYEPLVAAGDALRVTGRVDEYVWRFDETPGLLSTTEIVRPWSSALVIETLSSGNPVPAPVIVGTGGRPPPTGLVRPEGIAFWESLEGMLVTLPDAQAVGPRRGSGELAIVADRGGGATGMNARGGITVGPDDENPEWVLVRRDPGIADVTVPFADVGDLLGDVTGVLGYRGGWYEVYATEPLEWVAVGLEPEVAATARPGELRIASYNVHNLDPGDPASTFASLGRQIVESLGAPEVIALQEIQDDDGTPSGRLSEDEAKAVSDVVTAGEIYARLLDAIVAAGGPRYAVAQVDPEDDADGGAPGGNIRVAFLHDPARVTLAAPARRLPGSEDPAGPFLDARKPLLAEFVFGDDSVLVVNAHLSSKYGSAPLYGEGGPTNAGVLEREAQAAFLNAWADGALAADPDARIVVLGDMNETAGGTPLRILTGEAEGAPALWDAAAGIDAADRYTFLYGGNSQQLDHAFVDASLIELVTFDLVHLNAEFYGAVSDHDPVVLGLRLATPEPETAWTIGLGAVVLISAAWRRGRGRASPRRARGG